MAKETYDVNWKLDRGTEGLFDAGDTVELEGKEAETLLASGVISTQVKSEPEEVKKTPTELVEEEAASFDPPVGLSNAKNLTEKKALIKARREADAKAKEEAEAENA